MWFWKYHCVAESQSGRHKVPLPVFSQWVRDTELRRSLVRVPVAAAAAAVYTSQPCLLPWSSSVVSRAAESSHLYLPLLYPQMKPIRYGIHEKSRAAGNASWSDQCSGRAKLHYTRQLTFKQRRREHASARAHHRFHSTRRLIVKSTREACKMKMPFCFCCFCLWPPRLHFALGLKCSIARARRKKERKIESVLCFHALLSWLTFPSPQNSRLPSLSLHQ